MQALGLLFEHPTFDIDIRRCNNLCEFCFVLQMAPRFRRTLYIKDDDYRYSFLFGHFVTLTNLSEHDSWRIIKQGLSPLYVSVHMTDQDIRRRYLRNESAPDVLAQLKFYIDNGIKFHCQIVVSPEWNDGAILERSVSELAALYPGVQSVSVVPVGLTRHHKYNMRPNTSKEASRVLDQCDVWQKEFKESFGVSFVYPTDEWYLVAGRPVPLLEAIDGLDLFENGLGVVRRFRDEWSESQLEIKRPPKVTKVTLGTGTLFAPTLLLHAKEFTQLSGVDVAVVGVVNERLGETITCAGLLMGQDVIEQLGEYRLGDVVVLPRVMFDHPQGISLDDFSPSDIARELNTPVALADLMGDVVDITNGNPALYFPTEGESLIHPDAIKKDGGWAVEKLL
jgi:putative radical SAM enzyme (TIGR03279 family)